MTEQHRQGRRRVCRHHVQAESGRLVQLRERNGIRYHGCAELSRDRSPQQRLNLPLEPDRVVPDQRLQARDVGEEPVGIRRRLDRGEQAFRVLVQFLAAIAGSDKGGGQRPRGGSGQPRTTAPSTPAPLRLPRRRSP